MSSEGDDSSESGDSLTFAPKRTKSFPLGSELRQRFQDPRLSIRRGSSSSRSGDGGLGLLLGSPSSIPNTTSTSAGSLSGLEMTPKTVPQPLPNELERMIRRSSLLYLRLLAIVPAVWGICVLAQALATGGLWVDVWPYGVDLSKEALERLVAGGVMMEGEWIRVDRGDMVLCIAWVSIFYILARHKLALTCKLGDLYRAFLFLFDYRSHASMAIVLLSSINHHPPCVTSMSLLACDISDSVGPWCQKCPSFASMGRHWRDYRLVPDSSDVGNE